MMDVALHAATESPELGIWGVLLLVLVGVLVGRFLFQRQHAFECDECDFWAEVDREGEFHCLECGVKVSTYEYRPIDNLRDGLAEFVSVGDG